MAASEYSFCICPSLSVHSGIDVKLFFILSYISLSSS